MNESLLSVARNPFSASRLRPGTISYLFPATTDGSPSVGWLELETRFRAHDFRGQIVGPHGTGKSTLLADWQDRLQSQGHRVVSLRIQNCDGRRFGWNDWKRLALVRTGLATNNSFQRQTIVFVDGYEQLPAWKRVCIQSWLRFRRVGLLVTTHHSVGLPIIYETPTHPRLAFQVAKRMVSLMLNSDGNTSSTDLKPASIPSELVETLWREHDGDVRETLFALYDWWRTDVALIAVPAKSA